MSVLDEQRDYFLNLAVQQLLAEGIKPTVDLVNERFNLLLEASPLSEPAFSSSELEVQPHTSSSAVLLNQTHNTIKADLQTLYDGMFLLSGQSMQSFDRWRLELQRLESQLDSLDNRVTNLLLVTRDTEGYFSFVSDNFVDTDKIDMDRSDIVIDLGREIVTIGPTGTGTTRVFINNLQSSDVTFAVLSQKNLETVVEAPGSNLLAAFDDTSKYWQSRVYMSTPGPVVAELKVKISDTPISLSRITVQLHAANSTASIQITPLLSTDNFNYQQLPAENFSLSVVKTATFTFESTEATHIKFLMSKAGYDTVDGLSYVYEFGAEEISLYSEGYEADTSNILHTKPLSVTGSDSTLVQFNKVSLEACEDIPEETAINYFVAATITQAIPTLWTPIDPLNRSAPVNPVSINFAELIEAEVGNSVSSGVWVKVSYDSDNDPTTDPEFSNPAANFKLIDFNGTSTSTSSATASSLRYVLPTNSDRILDHQIKATVPQDETSMVVLRNVGLKGNQATVRGIQSGWKFAEPYYSTVVEIKNKDGFDINFGDVGLFIDELPTKGQVTLSQGFHLIRTHKDNWLDVTNDLTTLANLKAQDLLYPFNHKLLIEGYQYHGSWTEEKVYQGVDLFTELRMKQISSFDLLHSIPNDDYQKFSIDQDVADGARPASKVIIVKTDALQPDFQNERFVIRMNIDDGTLLFKYIWLQAEFVTRNPSVAPSLDNYMIRLGK